MYFSFISLLLASGAAILASPMPSTWDGSISARQAVSIPKNSLYLVEWYPEGCGNGGGETLNGYEELLGKCSRLGGAIGTANPEDNMPTATGIRFLFPDDGRVYKWEAYATEGCGFKPGQDMRVNYNPVILKGTGNQCVDVPKGKVQINPGAYEQFEMEKKVKIGAVRVYT